MLTNIRGGAEEQPLWRLDAEDSHAKPEMPKLCLCNSTHPTPDGRWRLAQSSLA